MGEVIRWAARYEVAWKPILTFDRRRMEYLDWLDREIDPVAFFEQADAVGAAPVSDLERIEVGRRGATLELRAPTADVANLKRPFEGVLTCFEPTRPNISEYRAHWSVDLDRDYADACAAFAKQLLPRPLAGSGAVPTDGAYLLDVLLDQDSMLLEFGIVSGSELAGRVEEPGNRLGGAPLPEGAGLYPPEMSDLLPPTSLYMDLLWSPAKRTMVETATDVVSAFSEFETRITNLVQDLAGSIQ